jgi:hypothetical protein
MEILYAYERQIPVILISNYLSLSPWLVYHSTKIVNTIGEATKIILEELK